LFVAGGLLSFVNEDIQKAVERKYLSDKDTTRQLHEELANFFIKIEDLSARKIDELPWQLEQASMWDMLKTTLSNLAIFDKLWIPANKFDLLRYWRSIEKNSQFEAYQCYKTVIDLSQFPPGMIVGDLMFELGQCLLEMAKYNGAEEVYYKAIEYFQKASQRLNVAKVYVDLATLYSTRVSSSIIIIRRRTHLPIVKRVREVRENVVASPRGI
jgi:tetratricopeptide (TPR) repeat protein